MLDCRFRFWQVVDIVGHELPNSTGRKVVVGGGLQKLFNNPTNTSPTLTKHNSKIWIIYLGVKKNLHYMQSCLLQLPFSSFSCFVSPPFGFFAASNRCFLFFAFPTEHCVRASCLFQSFQLQKWKS